MPALGILVAFFLDDVLARRDRLHPIYAALGIGIVLLVTRDLMWEPDRWIEVFTYRDDRPWPSGELYWRGEQFWSGGEIWGSLPDTRTTFPKSDNGDFLKYLGDGTRAPLGRRYFLITEVGRATSVPSILPTQRARDSFEIIDTTSNKFTLVAFYL